MGPERGDGELTDGTSGAKFDPDASGASDDVKVDLVVDERCLCFLGSAPENYTLGCSRGRNRASGQKVLSAS